MRRCHQLRRRVADWPDTLGRTHFIWGDHLLCCGHLVAIVLQTAVSDCYWLKHYITRVQLWPVSLQREQRYFGACAALPPTSPVDWPAIKVLQLELGCVRHVCSVVNWYLAACCTVQTQTRAFGVKLFGRVVCVFLRTKHSKTNHDPPPPPRCSSFGPISKKRGPLWDYPPKKLPVHSVYVHKRAQARQSHP